SYEQVQAITQALANAGIYDSGIEEELKANQDLQDALFALVNTQGVNLTDSVNDSDNALEALRHDTALQQATAALGNLGGLTYQSWRDLQADQQVQQFYLSLYESIGTTIPKKDLKRPSDLEKQKILKQYHRAAHALANMRFDSEDLSSLNTQLCLRSAWQRIQTDPTFATAVAVLGNNKTLSLKSLRAIEQETEEAALLVRAIAAFDDKDHIFSSDALKVNT
ncbi:hypothetical protein ACR9PT_14510, partial [Piscirickettsia salmonis]